MPLSEAQGAWVGDYLLGDYALPPRAEMLADIEADQRAMRERYVGLQAPHDPGRLRRLPLRAGEGAQGRCRPGPGKRLPSTRPMPTFCRHNRFIERCPICSKTLPGNEPAGAAPRRAKAGASSTRGGTGSRRGGTGLRVRREGRAAEDGYSNALVPGLHASADAVRLAEEIDFAAGRLAALALDPPGLYGELGPWPPRISSAQAGVACSWPTSHRPRTMNRSPRFVPSSSRPQGPRHSMRGSARCSSRRPSARAAPTSPAAVSRRSRPTPSGSPGQVTAGRQRRSAATGPGRPSGASRASMNASRCRASRVRGATNCSSPSAGWALRDPGRDAPARRAAGRRERGPHDAGRQAGLRDRRPAAAGPPRRLPGRGRRGADRGTRPGAGKLGLAGPCDSRLCTARPRARPGLSRPRLPSASERCATTRHTRSPTRPKCAA